MYIRDDEGTFVIVKNVVITYLSPIYHLLDNVDFAFNSMNVVDHFNKDIDGCH